MRLGYLGQIVELKGVHVLIAAVSRLPGAPLTLDLYGDLHRDPAYSRRLKQLAQLDPRIRWHGLLTETSQLRAAWESIDLLCVPSLWHENSPNVIHEAHAAGVPVLASDVGGIAEIVRHGQDGLLFPMGNAAALAQHIREILRRPDRLDELRAQIPRLRSGAEEVADVEAILHRVIDRQQHGQVPQ